MLEKQQLRVVSSHQLNCQILEFEFSRVDKGDLPPWQPGAHIELHLKNGMNRQYSLLSGKLNPNNWRIAVLIEEEGKGGSKYIRDNFRVGTEVEVNGPKNHFSLEDAEEYLFVAGGIGITPLIGMCQRVEESNKPWQLYYLGSKRADMYYVEELVSHYGEKVTIVARDESPRLDINQLISSLPSNIHVYSCGPERLIAEIENAMSGLDIHRVHVERFHPREIILTEPEHEFIVHCIKSDVEFVVPEDESIFMAADFEGIEIPGDCMEGTCGTCETVVVEGEIDHRDSVLSAVERAEGKKILPCVSRAKGNRLVLDL